MNGYTHIMSRLLNTPLWAHPTKVAVIYNVLAGRLGYAVMAIADDDPASQSIAAMRRRSKESRFVGEWPQSEEPGNQRTEPFRLTKQGVGVITVTGALINRGAFIGSHSGETSYEGIKQQLARAAGDSRVKSLILDLETPGGEANGAFETAAAVRAVAAQKPVIAIANGMAVSAGYALASGASKIIAAPSAMSGSIGTVMLHFDLSRQLDNEGITPTMIVAGARKMDGNPLEPLSEAATETLRGEVNRYYELFVDTVAAGRGRRTPAKAARETEGRIYIGREAIDARLVDDIGTFEDVLGELTRRAARSHAPTPATSNQQRRPAMDTLDNLEPVNSELQREQNRQALEHAVTEAMQRGASTMVARFKAIAADLRIKGKEAFALQLACEAPEMSADGVGHMCETIPAAAVPIPSIAERSLATGAEAISSQPMPAEQQAAEQQVTQGWTSAIDKANARTLAERNKHATRN